MQNVVQCENGQGSKELALMVFQITEKPGRILGEASSLSAVSSLSQPDTILPLQYFETLRRKSHLEGEKKLMLAVLEDAISCFQKYCSARDRRRKQLFHEAEEWIMEEKDEQPFSFNTICEVLEISPDYLRRGLLRRKEKKVSSRRQGNRRGLKTTGKDPGRSGGWKTAFDSEPKKYSAARQGWSHSG